MRQFSEDAVPGFRLVRRLSQGAGGEVFLAEEARASGIERAVKLLTPSVFAAEQNPEPRFQSEVGALYRLQHRAIVRYVTSGNAQWNGGETLYLVMEYVKGRSLQECYSDLPYEARIRTIADILDGLDHAHKARVFHRDVKPSNIMIRESDGQAVLVDFGLAYLLGDEMNDDRTKGVMGTPGYIPPESVSDPRKSRSPSHDIFQAAVTLYYVFAGRLPNPIGPLERLDRRLRALDPLLLRGMDPNPTQRWISGSEFANQLRSCADRMPSDFIFFPSPQLGGWRERLSSKLLTVAATEARKKEREEWVVRTISPFAVQIEECSQEAFREVHLAVSDMAPFISLRITDLEGEANHSIASQQAVGVCSLEYSVPSLSIVLFRLYERHAVSQSALSHNNELALANQRHEILWPAWLLHTGGGVPQSHYAFICVSLLPEARPVVLGFSMANSYKSRELGDAMSIKEFVVEALCTAMEQV